MDGHDRWLSKKNSEYVCGIPVPNNYNTKNIYSRFDRHSKSSGHILACTRNAEGVKNEPEEPISLSETEENQAIYIEPTEGGKLIKYIEKRLKPRFPWLEVSEGKLCCKVRNILMLS